MTQLAFDFDELVGIKHPPADVPVQCRFCGEWSATEFIGSLNHAPIHGMCSKAWLLKNHCAAIAKGIPREPGTPGNCYADGCTEHYRGEYVRKLPEACLRLEYDEKRAWLAKCGVTVEELRGASDGC